MTTLRSLISNILIFLILLIAFGGVAFAANQPQQSTYTPLAPLTVGNESFRTDLTGFIIDAFRFVIAFAAALAVFMVVMGGIQYMSTDAISGKKNGRARIEQALIGLLLVITSFLILQTINPKLVSLDLFSKDLSLTPGQVQQPVATPVESNSGTTSVAPIREYYRLGPDGKQHIITIAQNEDPNTVSLTDLYTLSVTRNNHTLYYIDEASCKKVESNTALYQIYANCHAVSDGPTYYYEVDISTNIIKNFSNENNQAACQQDADKNGWKCLAYVTKFSLTVAEPVESHTNLTQAACTYIRTNFNQSKTADETISDCIKQTKLQ